MYYPDNSERTIIKADPNWFVAWPWSEDGKQGVHLDPVIAWLIVHGAGNYHSSVRVSPNEKHVHASPYPITANGVHDNEQGALKDPDGRFLAYEKTWENEADLLASWPFDPQKTEAAPMERAR
jgi:hypothetical protein